VTFSGFNTDAIAFYRELTLNNDRDFWLANRDRYEERVVGPLREFAAALEPEFGAARLFRPYRDVRFSADKSPYKLAAGLAFERRGYVQISADGLAAGAGVYIFDRDQLNRYRQAVDAPGTGSALVSAIAAVEAAGYRIVVSDRLITAPRGFRREPGEGEHPRAELLRYKGLVTWTEWDVPGWFESAEAIERVAEFLRASEPVTEWLRSNVLV
jgi:uncharacterized protein (TIGR02453 family)